MASVPATMPAAAVADASASASSSSGPHSEIVALRASVRQLEQIIASHQMHTQRIIEQMRHEWRAAAAAAAASASHHAAAASSGIPAAAASLSSSPSRRNSHSVSPAPAAHALDPATLSLKDSFSARSRRGSVDPASASSHESVTDATQTNGCPHCTCKHKIKLTRFQRWMRKFVSVLTHKTACGDTACACVLVLTLSIVALCPPLVPVHRLHDPAPSPRCQCVLAPLPESRPLAVPVSRAAVPRRLARACGQQTEADAGGCR